MTLWAGITYLQQRMATEERLAIDAQTAEHRLLHAEIAGIFRARLERSQFLARSMAGQSRA